MSLLSSSIAHCALTSFNDPNKFPDSAMQPFTPGQCLFCPNPSPSFIDSVLHMQKSHGLFVPYQQQLIVGLEDLFKYLHLVIFGYRECIQCGTQRATVHAVQQHMSSKGHCRFDMSEEDSEFADFYNFPGSEGDVKNNIQVDGHRTNQQQLAKNSSQKSLLADRDSIRLPSGKIISRQSSAQIGLSVTNLRRRMHAHISPLEYPVIALENIELNKDARYIRLPSKKEKREKSIMTYESVSMSTSDRNGLMHLSPAQKRSILATQNRHEQKAQKEERRSQSRIERKGNKNLYAYWATETPIYQCG